MLLQTTSAMKSKINVTQLVGLLANVLIVFNIDLPPETQVQIVLLIQAVQGVATWVWRTWFTTKMTKATALRLGLAE